MDIVARTLVETTGLLLHTHAGERLQWYSCTHNGGRLHGYCFIHDGGRLHGYCFIHNGERESLSIIDEREMECSFFIY